MAESGDRKLIGKSSKERSGGGVNSNIEAYLNSFVEGMV